MRTRSTRFDPRAGRLLLVVLLAALAGLLAAPVQAQIADAVLETVVSDQSRAALPGVAITVIRPDTGYQQTAVTDELGVARLVDLKS